MCECSGKAVLPGCMLIGTYGHSVSHVFKVHPAFFGEGGKGDEFSVQVILSKLL